MAVICGLVMEPCCILLVGLQSLSIDVLHAISTASNTAILDILENFISSKSKLLRNNSMTLDFEKFRLKSVIV